MAGKNPGFEGRLEETGIREEVTAAAIKTVTARQLANEMRRRGMKNSRAQIGRLLDPNNGSATIDNLQRAAKILDRKILDGKILGHEPRRQQV
jgi:antitoxin HicB